MTISLKATPPLSHKRIALKVTSEKKKEAPINDGQIDPSRPDDEEMAIIIRSF